jgi:uncharacterized membrane protein
VTSRLREWAGGAFWLVPTGIVVTVGALALGLLRVDRALRERADVLIAFGGGPDSARDLLSVIATSTLSLTGLVFSITVVVLVLASSQYTPRVLRTFLRDRLTQVALGAFLATFVYALVALRAVRGSEGSPPDETFVPGLTLGVAYLLVLAAVGLFIHYISHIVQLVRIETIVTRIGADTRRTIERVSPPAPEGPVPPDPPPPEPPGGPARRVAADQPGIVTAVDVPRVVRAAAEAGVVVALTRGIGEFVPEGGPLLTIWGDRRAAVDAAVLRRAVTLRNQRTATADVAFGFRQLVDIAERALSPGVNDPTTAAQALDQIHDLLRRLGTRPLADGAHRDQGGAVRLLVPTPGWSDLVALALDEVRHWGGDSLQVRARLRTLLEDLLTAVPAHRAEPLRTRLAELDGGTRRAGE